MTHCTKPPDFLLTAALALGAALPAQERNARPPQTDVRVSVEVGAGNPAAPDKAKKPDPQPEHGQDWKQRLRKAGEEDPALVVRLRGLADGDRDGRLSAAEEAELEVLFRIHWHARRVGNVGKGDPHPERGADWRQRLRKAGDDDPRLMLRLRRLADEDGDGKLSDREEARLEFMFRGHCECERERREQQARERREQAQKDHERRERDGERRERDGERREHDAERRPDAPRAAPEKRRPADDKTRPEADKARPEGRQGGQGNNRRK